MEIQNLTYKLSSIEIWLHVGVPDAERAQKQRLLVDISFSAKNTVSFREDLLQDAPDYDQIYQKVKNFEQKKKEWKTLEALHAEMKRSIEDLGLLLSNFRLTIQKNPYKDASISVF